HNRAADGGHIALAGGGFSAHGQFLLIKSVSLIALKDGNLSAMKREFYAEGFEINRDLNHM
ncbi:hypothetical protein, partial [Lelliottia wanjuensis]|uniref:hypothetical protein n=1 Tax=Lelliottia wanjuensis TaxID=3050585 RepID=UPI0025505472